MEHPANQRHEQEQECVRRLVMHIFSKWTWMTPAHPVFSILFDCLANPDVVVQRMTPSELHFGHVSADRYLVLRCSVWDAHVYIDTWQRTQHYRCGYTIHAAACDSELIERIVRDCCEECGMYSSTDFVLK